MRKSVASLALLAATAAATSQLAFMSSASADGEQPVTIVRDPAVFSAMDSQGVATGLNGLTLFSKTNGDDTSDPTGTLATVTGPATPPRGVGSLRLSTGSNGNSGIALFDQSYLNYDLSPVIGFPISFNPRALIDKGQYYATATDTGAQIQLTVNRPGEAAPFQLDADFTPGTGWQAFDIQTMMFYKDADGPASTEHTLTDWYQTGDSIFAVLMGWNYNKTNDNPNKSLYLDDLSYGFNIGFSQGVTSPHPVNEYDFEPASSAPSVTASAAKTIVAGATTTVTATVTSSSTPVPTSHLDLLAKPAGAADFSKVASADTDASGVASITVSPIVNTLYKWVDHGTDQRTEHDGVASSLTGVAVKTAISGKPSKSSIKRGGSVSFYGDTFPSKAGTAVTLYQAKTGKDKVLDTAKTGKYGAFALHATFASVGKYKLYVYVAKTATNASNSTATYNLSVAKK